MWKQVRALFPGAVQEELRSATIRTFEVWLRAEL